MMCVWNFIKDEHRINELIEKKSTKEAGLKAIEYNLAKIPDERLRIKTTFQLLLFEERTRDLYV
jgi:hypothetical protein